MTETPEILEYAERPRVGDWTLRSALVRYAQPEPARAGAVLELVRRTDGALKPFARLVEATPGLVDVAATGSDHEVGSLGDEERSAVSLLAVALRLDRLGDVLAAWADQRSDVRPDGEVDAIAREVFGMLGDLGIERETRRS